MKNDRHHLKNIQKKLLRSSRNEGEQTVKTKEKENLNSNNSQEGEKEAVYDEFIPANQQVGRMPNRLNYH